MVMTVQIWQIFLVFLLVLSIFVVVPTSSATSDAGKPFRGSDDRVVLDSTEPPFTAIGRLNVGFGKQFCSATLIARDKVITAAHCLINKRTRRPYRPSQIHFVAGQRRDTYADHSEAQCVVPLKRRATDGSPEITKHMDDVAVIVLKRPLNVRPVTLAQAYIADPGPLSHPAYSRSRPYLLSIHRQCQLLHKARGIWLTDCDTSGGSSGGPVFAKGKTEPRLIAVMSGIAQASGELFSIAIPVTIWGSLARHAKCPGN